jgi:hypothetical protein
MNGPNPNPAKISNYMSRLLYDNDFFAEIIHFVALTTWQGVSRLPTKLPPKWAPRPFKLVHATKWLGSWKWFRTKWPCKSTLHGSGGQPFHSINFNGDVLIHIYVFARDLRSMGQRFATLFPGVLRKWRRFDDKKMKFAIPTSLPFGMSQTSFMFSQVQFFLLGRVFG